MPLTFNFVSQETFLHELARAEKYFSEAGRFVGLSHFIKGHLGRMGFDYRQSIKTAVWLQTIGRIEFYKVRPPAYEFEITAVRLHEISKVNPHFRSFQWQANSNINSQNGFVEDIRSHIAEVSTQAYEFAGAF